MSTDFDHAAELVRQYDKDRYLSALLAPPQHRAGLMALYAFNSEISRIRDLVSEPLPGEVRLQWWRDLLEGTEHGTAAANPVASALLQTIKTYDLPVQLLSAMAEARTFDLYNDPMPGLNDLEGYAGETVSGLIQLSCYVLNGGKDPATATAAGHAGVAYAMTGLMRALPWHAARQQMYLPKDVLDRHGVVPDTVFRGEASPQLSAALSEMRGHVRHHLKRVKAAAGDVPVHCKAAFLPLALVPAFLGKLEADGFDPLKNIAEISQLKRQWILWRASRRPLERL
ncbi:squalene/phytoene synthase family protein [Roseibium denhamense]|uniref:Phytoene synthase n=1 Tax=Roseibium denhamense TaxID=76305 RepID=A0ABY1PET1_9HYPH|nr:phytoene/squalene synthase family protein [Roseibium denhamense]MTI06151.1 squalene/phytoene synthase family protein [Roseibium denhamense]SMP32245.1 phytoene synthase [Roseibium denhamense]